MVGKPAMVLAVDIETSGPRVLQNGILAIGMCLGTVHGRVLDKHRIDVKLDMNRVFDTQCMEDFWNKTGPKQVLDVIRQHPLSPKAAIEEFVRRVDSYDTMYDLIIISDNPTFDLYFLNYYVEYYLQRKPLNYKFGEHYRKLVDAGSMRRKKQLRLPPGVKHDHFPENDAEYIYMCYMRNRYPHLTLYA